MDVATIIGSVTGIVSLLGIIYMIGWWKGQVDSKLRNIEQQFTAYPLPELAMMTKTLWNVYVINALGGRPDLAEQHSAFKLSKEGYDMIPDALKEELDQIPVNPSTNKDSIASGYLVVKHLGMDKISIMAKESGLSVQEAIAILSLYLDEKHDTG